MVETVRADTAKALEQAQQVVGSKSQGSSNDKNNKAYCFEQAYCSSKQSCLKSCRSTPLSVVYSIRIRRSKILL